MCEVPYTCLAGFYKKPSKQAALNVSFFKKSKASGSPREICRGKDNTFTKFKC